MRNAPPQLSAASPGAGFLALIEAEPSSPRNDGTVDDDMLVALAERLWAAAVRDIPCLFGRLEFLACLRQFGSGEYEHYGLELAIGRAAGSELARRTHVECFSAWLRLEIREKVSDVCVHFANQVGRGRVFEELRKLPSLLRLVPEAATAEERLLFLTELETVAEVLAYAHDMRPVKRAVLADALLRGTV